MHKLKVAMIQMLVEFDVFDSNIKRAEAFISEAASKGAQICVVPECSDIGWANPDAFDLASPVPGRVSDEYCRIAKQNNIFIAAGVTEKDDERLYNSALLISNKGEILIHHRKINVFVDVEDMYSIGGSLSIAETELGTIGIDICADNFYNSIAVAHVLARMGAQIILSPSSWVEPADRDITKDPYGDKWFKPYKQIASIYNIPVIGVSNVGHVIKGARRGYNAIGSSIAVDSDAGIIKMLPYGADAQTMEIVEVTMHENRLKGTALSDHAAKLMQQQ